MNVYVKHVVLALCAATLIGAGAADDAGGDAKPPTSRGARQALATLEDAKARAEAAYKDALKQAAKLAVKDLQVAKNAALRSKDLDEANRIVAAIATVEGTAQEAQSGVKPVVTRVDAKEDWQSVGEFQAGDKVSLTAKGQWSFDKADKKALTGPDGTTRLNERFGYLEGRIGETVFPVGKTFTFTAKEAGILQLRMHDPWKLDNMGSVDVAVKTEPAGAASPAR